MQAIHTYRLPRLNSWRALCKAENARGDSIVVPWNSQDNDQAHRDAALALMEKLGWRGEMVGGTTAKGMVWVFAYGSSAIKRSG